MVSFFNYKGYGIEYFAGITKVSNYGITLKVFRRFGEMDGTKKAKDYIDNVILREVNYFK